MSLSVAKVLALGYQGLPWERGSRRFGAQLHQLTRFGDLRDRVLSTAILLHRFDISNLRHRTGWKFGFHPW